MTSDPSSPTQEPTNLLRQALEAYNSSDFPTAIDHSQAALEILARTNDPDQWSLVDEVYERLSLCYQRIGDLATARAISEEWLSQAQHERSQLRAHIQLGRIASFTGDYDKAMHIARDVEARVHDGTYRRELGSAKRVRADTLWKLGRSEEALMTAQEALRVLEQAGDLEQTAATHISLSAAYYHGGRFYKAIEHLQRAIRIFEQLGRQYELTITYSNLGETYAALYLMDLALEAHRKALQLVGIEHAHPDLLRNMGADLIALGEISEGKSLLVEALERAKKINDPDLIAQCLYSLAQCAVAEDQLELAEAHSNELLDYASQLDSLRHHMRALMLLGEIARRRNDGVLAQAHFSECSMLAQQSVDRHMIWRTHAALAELLRDSMPRLADIHRRMASETMVTILSGIEDDDLRRRFREAGPVEAILGPTAP